LQRKNGAEAPEFTVRAKFSGGLEIAQGLEKGRATGWRCQRRIWWRNHRVFALETYNGTYAEVVPKKSGLIRPRVPC